MPAFASHYIFAKEMLPFIRQTADFNVCDDAVLIGSQGPDIFFFGRIFPWQVGKPLAEIGSKLHRAKPSSIFESMRDYAEKSLYYDIAKSYIYGFMLHYALDRKCHPYVYSLQDRLTEERRFLNSHTAHNIIENSADSYLLNKRMYVQKPHLFDTSKTITDDKNITAEIGRLWEYVLPFSTGIKLTAKQAQNAVGDTKYAQKMLLDRQGVKRLLLSPAETAVSPITKNYKITSMLRPKDLEKAKKYVNIDRNEWLSPFSDMKSTDSFEELFDKARQEAEVMLLRFQSGDDCEKITGNLSFLTGVEVK